MWKKVVGGVIGVGLLGVGGLAAFIAMQPDVQHIERSRVVAAGPADLWPLVGDLRGFIAWSPWEELDPTMNKAFSTSSSGVGAWYTWEGNDDVGKGRMEIVEEEPPLRVTQELAFIEPFASRADVTVALAKEGEKTKITWAFDMDQSFGSKAIGLVMDMDAVLGADFERGLAKLDAVATQRSAERVAAEAAAAAEAKRLADEAAALAAVAP